MNLSRRSFLHLGAAAGGVALVGQPLPATAQVAAPPIMPRSNWGADLPPTGALEAEQPGDVRFLLVHHTASGNSYGPGEAIGQLQSFYRFHTGPEKGWPDIAYNFLIDRYGVVYEGREGSIDAPVKVDATGGSQGFAVLACFIGDLEAEPPTPQAEQAMVDLLTWLAARYRIDPQASTSFVSRGSSRWPAGEPVTTTTIAGHRDMSQTTCPGQFGYDLVQRLPVILATRLGAAGAASPPPPVPVLPTDPEPPPTTPPAPALAAPTYPPGTPVTTPPPVTSTPIVPSTGPTADALALTAPQPTATLPVTPPPARIPVAIVEGQQVRDRPAPATVVGGAAALVALVAAGLFDVIRRRGGLR